MQNMFQFTTIAEFHKACGLAPPEHPLVSLIDYSQVKYPVQGTEMKWVQHFYSIGLKRNINAKFNYGQQAYDFDAGILTFVSPLQFLKLEIKPEVIVEPSGWLLLIHPDFLWKTSLAQKIKHYDFFHYSVKEALFLSEKEESQILELLHQVRQEYRSQIDKYTQDLIITQIEMILLYAERYYERQFHTRRKGSLDLLEKFESLVLRHLEQGIEEGIPSVTAISEQMHISANYLSTLLRLHTQQSAQQHIQNAVIEKAKEKLSTTTMTVSEVAYALGFQHPQSFSKLFKNKTRLSPLEFRREFQRN
jgi:AraC family transcriptional activator of pobA